MEFPQDPLENFWSSHEYVLQQGCWGIKENAQSPKLLVPRSSYTNQDKSLCQPMRLAGKKRTFLYHDALSTALNLLLFPLKIIASLGYCPEGRKQSFARCKTFCWHLCLVVTSMFFYLGFLRRDLYCNAITSVYTNRK